MMLPAAVLVPLTLVVSSIFRSGIAQENELIDISSCSCPGCELVLECTIVGGGATIWQGTILDGCQNEKITLRHSQFMSGTVVHESCGAMQPIVGRSVSVAHGSFISQLLVNISEDLFGRTIECANNSGQIIGSKQIDISSISALLININASTPWNSKTGELNITWDLEYNDTLNSSGILNVTQFYYTVNTSNCGTCQTTISSTSTTCNLTASDLLAGTCNITVIVHVMGCDITTSEQYSVHLINDSCYTSATPYSITEQMPKRKGWSTVAVSLPLVSTGVLLLLVLAIGFLVAIMKYRSKRKTRTVLNLGTEGQSDHSNDPIGSDINLQDLGQYSLLQHPSNEEGVMTYLEIGPDTRVRTNIIPSADRVEYAEVKHTHPQNSVKNDVDRYLNLDTLLIQVRCQVAPLWHEFGMAAGVPVDTLNKCLNCTPEESVVEVLDYWLRQGRKTWRDVARVLNEIHLQELAEKLLKVYDTGLLPTAVVDEDIILIPAIAPDNINVILSNNSEVISKKSQSPPPLPPKLKP